MLMTVEEYEAIRLIDYQGCTQAECSEYMCVARTTAQQIYNSARAKLAAALVEGRPLRIEGGSYRLCEGGESTAAAPAGGATARGRRTNNEDHHPGRRGQR